MRLQEIMTTPVISIGPEDAADSAWSRMETKGIRHLVVKDGARLVGVLSERDLGGRNGSGLRTGRTVRELMPPKVVTAKPGTTLREAANLDAGTAHRLPTHRRAQPGRRHRHRHRCARRAREGL